jgi:Domain of unknown function (DUF5658)
MLRALRSEVSTRLTTLAFRWVLIAYALVSVLDWVTTNSALALGGHERNPIAASLYAQYGSVALLLFKAAVVAVIIAVLARIPRRIMSERIAVWVGIAFVVVTAVAVIGNTDALASLAHGASHHAPAPSARLV